MGEEVKETRQSQYKISYRRLLSGTADPSRTYGLRSTYQATDTRIIANRPKVTHNAMSHSWLDLRKLAHTCWTGYCLRFRRNNWLLKRKAPNRFCDYSEPGFRFDSILSHYAFYLVRDCRHLGMVKWCCIIAAWVRVFAFNPQSYSDIRLLLIMTSRTFSWSFHLLMVSWNQNCQSSKGIHSC